MIWKKGSYLMSQTFYAYQYSELFVFIESNKIKLFVSIAWNKYQPNSPKLENHLLQPNLVLTIMCFFIPGVIYFMDMAKESPEPEVNQLYQ